MTKLKIYGRADCVQCKATTRKADDLGLPYEYIDLDAPENAPLVEELAERGLRSLPVVEDGEEVWTGFIPIRLKAAAESHGR